MTHKSVACHVQKLNNAGYMVAQVLDLRRTGVQPAMTQHFLWAVKEGLVFDALAAIVVSPAAINPFLFLIACQRGHTP